ncbi:DUF664 domain-containing protein [Streptomyces sp. NPDC056244]|uniref:mycothiol transferase n=1 Tax=Streptomyces sp. NPDC056244 TaxID=3345762 RepID=UPI0035DFBFD2
MVSADRPATVGSCWAVVRHRRRTLRRRRLHPGLKHGRWCASGSLEAMGRTPGRACASYEDQCAGSNEIVAAASSDDVGRHPGCRSGNANLRWMPIHLVDETISSMRPDGTRGMRTS